MQKIKTPAALLTAAVFADKPVKPALEPTGQVEISAVDGQHERVIENAGIEPIRQDQFQTRRTPTGVGRFLPFVDPGETMPPPLCRLADRRQHRSCLQSVETCLETIVVARAGTTANEGQNFVMGGGHQARGFQARVARLNNLGGGPDQDISVPDRRHAVLRHRFDANGDRARAKIDRRNSL